VTLNTSTSLTTAGTSSRHVIVGRRLYVATGGVNTSGGVEMVRLEVTDDVTVLPADVADGVFTAVIVYS
jgi:hypothetical protein